MQEFSVTVLDTLIATLYLCYITRSISITFHSGAVWGGMTPNPLINSMPVKTNIE